MLSKGDKGSEGEASGSSVLSPAYITITKVFSCVFEVVKEKGPVWVDPHRREQARTPGYQVPTHPGHRLLQPSSSHWVFVPAPCLLHR